MKKRKIPKVDELELPARLQKQIGKLQVCAESLLVEVYAVEGQFNVLTHRLC